MSGGDELGRDAEGKPRKPAAAMMNAPTRGGGAFPNTNARVGDEESSNSLSLSVLHAPNPANLALPYTPSASG